MKKLLLLSIVFISVTAFSQIQSVKYYSPDDAKSKNGSIFYKIDTMGGAIGVEFIKGGLTYLVVGGGSMPNFSADNREADAIFRKYIKVGTTYGFLYEYRRTISDDDYMYGNPTKTNFGKYESQPYLDSVDVTVHNPHADTIVFKPHILKVGLQTEAQFFIDNIIKNKYHLPISISNFIYLTIVRVEGL